MKEILGLTLFFLSVSLFAQTPQIQWQQSYGGSGSDFLDRIEISPDTSYVLMGNTSSNDGTVGTNILGYWLIKIDTSGVMLWQKVITFDGGVLHYDHTIDSDGNIIVAGGLGSSSEIIKFNPSGQEIWHKTYEYENPEGSREIEEIKVTSDGGFIIVGAVDVFSEDNDEDVWITKFTSDGVLQWEKIYGGSDTDFAKDFVEIADSNYIVFGESSSDDGDVSGHYGNPLFPDYWVMRINQEGDLIWEKNLGGSEWESAASILKDEFSIVLVGESLSIDGDIDDPPSPFTTWLVRLDDDGNILDKKKIGQNFESVYDATINSSGDIFLYGRYPQNVWDVWIAKVDNNFETIWFETFGGSEYELSYEIVSINDSTILITANSNSDNGDVALNYGGGDAWVVSIAETDACINNITNTLCYGESIEVGGEIFNESNPSGQVTIDGGGSNGCDSIVNVDLTFLTEIIITDTVIRNDNGTGNGIIFTQASGGSGNFTYEWNTGETSSAIFNLSAGTYMLTITDSNGCSAEFTFEVELMTGVDEQSRGDISIHPNPASSILTVTTPSKSTITLFEINGKAIETWRNQIETNTLDVSTHPVGVYLLQVEMDDQTFTNRVVINR